MVPYHSLPFMEVLHVAYMHATNFFFEKKTGNSDVLHEKSYQFFHAYNLQNFHDFRKYY